MGDILPSDLPQLAERARPTRRRERPGRTFPGSSSNSNGPGMTALLHTGGDAGDSSYWRAGISVLNAKATRIPASSPCDWAATGTNPLIPPCPP